MKRLLAILAILCGHALAATTTSANVTTNTNNTATYASGAFTPAANDLLVVLVMHTGTSITSNTLTSSVGGQSFTKMLDVTHTLNARDYVFIADTLSTAVSQTVTFNRGDASNGTGITIFVIRVSGMTRTGSAAARQISPLATGSGGATPAATLASSALTGNPTIAFLANSTNPAGMTPPTSWTELVVDQGYASPTAGSEYATRDSGFTGTVVTWGSTSASVWGVVAVELDTSAAAPSGRKREPLVM
jgi:hypothetical protein